MGYGLWVMGLNARSLAICAWLAWRKPNHRLPIPAFKVGKTDYLTVEYAVEQNQNTGYKNILILKLTGKKGNKFYNHTMWPPCFTICSARRCGHTDVWTARPHQQLTLCHPNAGALAHRNHRRLN